MKWKQQQGRNNQTLTAEDFYISYNPATGDDELGSLITMLGNAISPDELSMRDGEETALRGPDRAWYILEGDFRKEYEEAFPKGFEACLQVYKANISKRSNWSTD